jgi:hypothetical protein
MSMLLKISAPSGPNADAYQGVMDQVMPMVFEEISRRFGITSEEAADFWKEHITIDFISDPEKTARAWVRIPHDGKAAVTINTDYKGNTGIPSPETLSGSLIHELEHFFQETLIYEYDKDRLQEVNKNKWIDREHEQGALLAEIQRAKAMGVTKEEFKDRLRKKYVKDYAHRMEVVDMLWDMADDVMPGSVVGHNDGWTL